MTEWLKTFISVITNSILSQIRNIKRYFYLAVFLICTLLIALYCFTPLNSSLAFLIKPSIIFEILSIIALLTKFFGYFGDRKEKHTRWGRILKSLSLNEKELIRKIIELNTNTIEFLLDENEQLIAAHSLLDKGLDGQLSVCDSCTELQSKHNL